MVRSVHYHLRNFFHQILSIIVVASVIYVIVAFANAPQAPEDPALEPPKQLHAVSPFSVGTSSLSASSQSGHREDEQEQSAEGNSGATQEAPASMMQEGAGPGPGREIATAGKHASVRASEQSEHGEVDQYLWDVYRRSSVKWDSHGDFTWKDAAAAERLGLSVQDYVIGGMDPDFRELLFHAGSAMDAAGVAWTVLSGFRDDYRQELAVGLKAHVGNSFHGGSVATGGYGHGCAVDVASPDGVTNSAVWNWLDQHGAQFGLHRPLHDIDPAHVQPFGAWHSLAATLRKTRLANSERDPAGAPGEASQKAIPALAEHSPHSGVAAEQYNCVRQRPVIEAAASELAIHLKRLLSALPGLAHERRTLLHEKNEPTVLTELKSRQSIEVKLRDRGEKNDPAPSVKAAGRMALRREGLRHPAEEIGRHTKPKGSIHAASSAGAHA
jgi:hypothetical protein